MAKHAHTHGEGCTCCSAGLQSAMEAVGRLGLSRRELMLGAGSAAVAAWLSSSPSARAAEPAAASGIAPAKDLVVQPVLTYATPTPVEQRSWRSWGGIQTEADATAEVQRIEAELKQMTSQHGLAVRWQPVVKVRTKEDAAQAKNLPCDVMLIYAAGGGRDLLEIATVKGRPTLFFLRHRSGPVSLHYEILHPHFLRKASDNYADTGVDVHDVVVDEYADLAWRMRALVALRKTLGYRICAVGGPYGWGAGRELAPPFARDTWKLDIRTESYEQVAERIKELNAKPTIVAEAHKQADAYLADPGVRLKVNKEAVQNAFVLYKAFKDMMADHDATAMTIMGCMGTIMPISKTTACLPLSLLNDEGYLAFCESDFVVIPSGILMHHIMGTPVFLNDPTWPHHGIVTLAHCTAPRRMNGKKNEPVEILTHFESDYGAAPKVEMTTGQVVTNVIPDFASRKWVGALGTIEANPFHAICRSQIDVAIHGDWEKLLADMRGFHWMTVYGDCMKEVGYAIKHLGIGWEDVSTT